MKIKQTIGLLIICLNCLFTNFIQANQYTTRSKEIVTEHGTGHGITPPETDNFYTRPNLTNNIKNLT
tara:strand:+ start:283 stop:483 length:201 start_codon:yes stop_codon:yes gene_type:complete